MSPGPKAGNSTGGTGARRSTNTSLYKQPVVKWPPTTDIPGTRSRWQEHALCAGPHERNHWFPLDQIGAGWGGAAEAAQRDEDRRIAKTTCARCPVKAACAQLAKDMPPAGGIWGGVEYNADGTPKTDLTEELF